MLDRDLARVSYEHYITGASAINWISDDAETGGWHRLNYFDSGMVKVALAGIHYPDTRRYFGSYGVINDTARFESLGVDVLGRQVYVASHYRAAADIVLKWAISSAVQCSVEISDWFPRQPHVDELVALFEAGKQRLEEDYLWKRVQGWLSTQITT